VNFQKASKKLHILGQELQAGYDPFLANQLLKRKLRLSDDQDI
jgi:hypothetical protein